MSDSIEERGEQLHKRHRNDPKRIDRLRAAIGRLKRFGGPGGEKRGEGTGHPPGSGRKRSARKRR